MSKDAYWFKHDSSAGRGIRLRKIQHIYKHWGKGIYWDVVELLREQGGYKYPVDESSLLLLCSLIGCDDIPKFMSWFSDCIKVDLLRKDGINFYCPRLSETMRVWDTSKANGSKGGRPPKPIKKAKNGDKNQSDNQADNQPPILNGNLNESNRVDESRLEERRGEQNISDLKNAFTMKEQTARHLRATAEQVETLLADFIQEQQAAGGLDREFKEIRKHFVSWAKIKHAKKSQETSKQKHVPPSPKLII